MKKGLCEIVAILDKSGSMSSVRTDALGGINTFISEQKKLPGEALFTLVLFDSSLETKLNGVNIKSVSELSELDYIPGSLTALLDAIGSTIDSVGNRLSNTPESERPEKVIVAILTDGFENASHRYTKDKIFSMITHQTEKYGWEFVFLAANQDAIQAGTSLGIASSNSFAYVADGVGMRSAYSVTLNNIVSNLREPR